MRFLFFTFLFFSCSGQNFNYFSYSLCNNSNDLISKADSITDFLEIDLSKPYDTLINQYQYQKLPTYLELGNDLFIKVEFETSDNFSTGMRMNNFEEVLINSKNQILYKGNYLELKELHKTISTTAQLDKNLKFVIKWDDKTSRAILNQVFQEVVLGYVGLIETNLELDICSLSEMELNKLKIQYPLVFLFRNFNPNINPSPIPLAHIED